MNQHTKSLIFSTLYESVHQFFKQKNYIEVKVPPLTKWPTIDTHVHPFQVEDLFLHTSPEFEMKKILSDSPEQAIYSMEFVFRNEPRARFHRPQFLMLEWYEAALSFESMIEDTFKLCDYLRERLYERFPRYFRKSSWSHTLTSVDELFQNQCGFSILDYLDATELRQKIEKDFKEVPLPSSELEWDDLFFLIFLNLVEPHFSRYDYLSLTGFPRPLAALAKVSEDDARVSERFEVYMNGLEICNAYHELTEPEEQKVRAKRDLRLKEKLYQTQIDEPKNLYEALERGLPPCSGNALGLERLLYKCLNDEYQKSFDSFFIS